MSGDEATYRQAAALSIESAAAIELEIDKLGTRSTEDDRIRARMGRKADACRSTALIMATLELANQQRIANLIALEVIGGGPLSQYPGDMAGEYLETHYPDVAEALGVRDLFGGGS